MEHLRAEDLRGLPLIAGGRSSGARVACRTAPQTKAAGVLCLAFPLQPPARKGKPPAKDRLDELDSVTVPTLVVQGVGDQFGTPPPGEHREVVQVKGSHSLSADTAAVAGAVQGWLDRLL